jgi:hypothetical protein
VNFEAYLHSKKIDSVEFMQSEKSLWESLRIEFDQMSPASFTAQKLYLINPIRRKYQLKIELEKPASPPVDVALHPDGSVKSPGGEAPPQPAKPAVARPVMRPKPKMN